VRWLRIEGCRTRDGNQLCLRHGNKIEHGAPKARHVAAEDIRIRDVRLIQEPQRHSPQVFIPCCTTEVAFYL